MCVFNAFMDSAQTYTAGKLFQISGLAIGKNVTVWSYPLSPPTEATDLSSLLSGNLLRTRDPLCKGSLRPGLSRLKHAGLSAFGNNISSRLRPAECLVWHLQCHSGVGLFLGIDRIVLDSHQTNQ